MVEFLMQFFGTDRNSPSNFLWNAKICDNLNVGKFMFKDIECIFINQCCLKIACIDRIKNVVVIYIARYKFKGEGQRMVY